MAVIQEGLRPLASAAGALPATRTSALRTGLWLVGAGWAALTLMWVTGSADGFGHDQGSLSAILAIGLFLVGWTVMVAAMMLPSTLPTLQRMDETWGARRGMAPARFMGGYFSAWGAFGAAAFAGDGILHLLVDDASWLAQRPSLIAGGVAMVAGVAYVPQVWHLVRVHCAAGISRFAFSLWLGAALLVTTNAVATGATLFIVLGGVQIAATALVLIYATKYRSTYCDGHMPVDPGEVLIGPAITGSTEGPRDRVKDVPAHTAAASLGRG